MDQMAFATCVGVAADFYGRKPFGKEALKMFFLTLQDFTLVEVQAAFVQHMKASPWMPKPCELIDIMRVQRQRRYSMEQQEQNRRALEARHADGGKSWEEFQVALHELVTHMSATESASTRAFPAAWRLSTWNHRKDTEEDEA
jgi:hypothetical protein